MDGSGPQAPSGRQAPTRSQSAARAPVARARGSPPPPALPTPAADPRASTFRWTPTGGAVDSRRLHSVSGSRREQRRAPSQGRLPRSTARDDVCRTRTGRGRRDGGPAEPQTRCPPMPRIPHSRRVTPFLRLCLGAALALLLAPALALAQANGKLQIHHVNVGQGDGILLISP